MKLIHTLRCALAQELSNPASRYAIIKLFQTPIMPACLHKVPGHVDRHQVEMFTCIPKSPSYLPYLSHSSCATTTIE